MKEIKLKKEKSGVWHQVSIGPFIWHYYTTSVHVSGNKTTPKISFSVSETLFLPECRLDWDNCCGGKYCFNLTRLQLDTLEITRHEEGVWADSRPCWYSVCVCMHTLFISSWSVHMAVSLSSDVGDSLAAFRSHCQANLQWTFEMLQRRRGKKKVFGTTGLPLIKSATQSIFVSEGATLLHGCNRENREVAITSQKQTCQ